MKNIVITKTGSDKIEIEADYETLREIVKEIETNHLDCNIITNNIK